MTCRIISSAGPGVVVAAILALILGLAGFVVAMVAESYWLVLFCGGVLLIGAQAAGRILAYRSCERQIAKRFNGT